MDGVRGLLADRRFRRLMIARTVSVFGSAMAPIALAFAVLGLVSGAQATQLGTVLFARMLAQVGFLLYGGVLADRFSRQRMMVVADLSAAATQAAIGVLLLSGRGSIAALIVLAFLNGLASAVFIPASDGILPLLVPAARVKDARALVQTGENAARIIGAAGAGAVVAVAGPGWALLLDAATFACSALLLGGMGLPPVERVRSHSLLAELRGGLREVTSREWMWVSLVQWSVFNFCISGGVFVLGPVLAAQRLGGALAWSAVIGVHSVGFLVGSLLVIRVNPRRPMRTATVWTLGLVTPVLTLALGAPLWLFALAMFLTGICMTVGEVLTNAVTMTQIPEEALSRAGAYQSLASMVLVPSGFAAVGPISDLFGVRRTLLGYAVLMLVAIAGALSSRSVRTVSLTG
jgi:MFS family permease